VNHSVSMKTAGIIHEGTHGGCRLHCRGRRFSDGLSIPLGFGIRQSSTQGDRRSIRVGMDGQDSCFVDSTRGSHRTGHLGRRNGLLRRLSDRYGRSASRGSCEIDSLNVCSALKGIASEALSVDS
jgi:hypothetical protein